MCVGGPLKLSTVLILIDCTDFNGMITKTALTSAPIVIEHGTASEAQTPTLSTPSQRMMSPKSLTGFV